MTKLKALKESVNTLLGREWTVAEKVLIIANCLLLGTIIGMIFAPRKGNVALGSYNSSFSAPDFEEGWIDEED